MGCIYKRLASEFALHSVYMLSRHDCISIVQGCKPLELAMKGGQTACVRLLQEWADTQKVGWKEKLFTLHAVAVLTC